MRAKRLRTLVICAAALLCCAFSSAASAAARIPGDAQPRKTEAIVDTLRFGNAASEKAHGLTTTESDVITGGLSEPARRLLPLSPPSWEGGRLAFTLKVDPAKPNSVTIRLWGGDVSVDRLVLFCEGKQIGYHHLGDVDLLDFGTDSDSPGFNGRFFYNTTPLPVPMTQGKRELHFEIRSIGRIWGYGTTFDEYQKTMVDPTRGIYALYSHTDGYFVPPAREKQGEAPANPPVRQTPGPEVLDQVKARVNAEIDHELSSQRPLNQMQMQFLAKAYYVRWTHAYTNPQVVSQVIRGLDHLFAEYRRTPNLARSEPSTYNPDWFGFGPAGDAVRLLAGPMRASLDEQIDGGAGGRLLRRAAWSEMLQASRDWHRRHRREYTNQSMIIDMYVYADNRGIMAIDPAHALPEGQTLHYLYQSVGLEPWLGSDTDHGPEKPLGDHYYELTRKGLTRELGYVGYYGEVLDWVAQLYDGTRPTPDQPGDPKLKAQMERIIHARAVFRYPTLDAEGNRAMRIETIVGWRDAHYPGDITYGERPSWDGSALYALAATMDSGSVASAQQMFADNQFFASLQESMKTGGLRTTAGLLGAPEEYEKLKAQPPAGSRLPMTPGQPDFAFADEEDGVVALKHGSDILYVSLYWRAHYAINRLARVHYIAPRVDRIAVVRQEEQFEPSGLEYTIPDWYDQGFAWNSHHYPGDLHQALAGETLPIAKIPDGVTFRPGDANSYAGRASFYACHYGDYLIGMNSSEGRSYTLAVPSGVTKAPELVSGTTVALPSGGLTVKPLSTVVLYLGGEARATPQRTTRTEANMFNMVAGTQAIGGSYQFTRDPMLVEAAHAILEMGSNTIKFSLVPDASDGLKPHNLTEVARDARSMKTTLDLPFANYLLWVYPISSDADRFRPESLPGEYREIYDLTHYLLKTYAGTGKTFYLGNWEGDWHLTHLNPSYVPTDEEVRNMIAWANMRQKAVDDARRDTAHRNVQVYYYLEVNLVADAMAGKVRLTNAVLPHTNVDFVSYSSYDAINGEMSKLTAALDYIESQLPPKPGIQGKRVFIGEYGFPTRSHSPEEQNTLSCRVVRTALAWGCPFALYWELYNNEVKDGKQMGFWMIDDHQVKQPVYETHRRYYAWARHWVADFKQGRHRLPTQAEFDKAAVAWFDQAAAAS